MSILEKEIERVSNLWSDWVEIHGVDSLPDRRKSVEKEISEVLEKLENEEDSNFKSLNHAKLLTGQYKL